VGSLDGFSITTTTFDEKKISSTLLWMFIPSLRAHMVAYNVRMLEKIAEFGFILDYFICLNVSRAFSENPFCVYLEII